jgi:hypothetical protein
MAAHRALSGSGLHRGRHRGLHRAVRRTGRRSRRVLALVAAVAALVTGTQVAFAYFTSTGTALGSVTTGTFAPPTAVTGAQSAGTGTVNVSWTAPAGTPSATGYYVLRFPSSGPSVPACGTSAASPTTSTSCADSGVALGTYTYVVVAKYRTWTSTSAPSATVTVAQTSQTITFTSSPVSPTFGGTYTVTATGGGSGNPVVFSAATPGVCTVTSGGSVTFVHAGTCTINANQAGSTYYAAAPQNQQTFAVAKAPQTVSFTTTAPAAAVVGGAGYTPAATGGGSGNAVTFSIDATTAANCSISGGLVTYQHAGSCTVDANQAGNADYLAASQVQQSYAVGKGSQAISFTSTAPVNAKVSGSTYTVTATGGASGNAVTFSSATTSVCTLSGSVVSFVGAGTCTINADQAGNADYLAAAQVQQSFAVTKNAQTITFTSTAPGSATFGGSYNATATASSGLAVTFSTDTASVCTVTSGGSVSFVGVGTCHVLADQGGNFAYNAAPQVQQSFTVAKASQAITFTQPTTPASASTSATLVATSTSGLMVTFSTSSAATICTVSGTTVNYVGAGSCVILADQAGNADYLAAPQVSRTVTVTGNAFAITGRSSASPQNTTAVSGTGTTGGNVSVYICNGTQSSCGAGSPNLVSNPNFSQPQSTVVAGGTWSVSFSKLGNGVATYTVQAFETTPSATSAVFTFTTS